MCTPEGIIKRVDTDGKVFNPTRFMVYCYLSDLICSMIGMHSYLADALKQFATTWDAHARENRLFLHIFFWGMYTATYPEYCPLGCDTCSGGIIFYEYN